MKVVSRVGLYCILIHSLFYQTASAIQLPNNTQQVLERWATYCPVWRKRGGNQFKKSCRDYQNHTPSSTVAAKQFITQHFHLSSATSNVLRTAYYSPTISASLQPTKKMHTPILALTQATHCSRQQINRRFCSSKFKVLAWTTRIDRFFLQIQGSGCLRFENDMIRCLSYGGRNGLPYTAIGSWFLKKHIMQKKQISMQSLKQYLRQQPKQAADIMNLNASFIFFRWQAHNNSIGAYGHTLTPRISIATDKTAYPMGSLILTQGKHPQLMLTEDTGSAIKGKKHIDWFLGKGKKNALQAGHERSRVTLYRLIGNHHVT